MAIKLLNGDEDTSTPQFSIEPFITGSFCNWRNYLDKIKELKNKGNYLDVIFIALCCFVDELSNILSPQSGVKTRFKALLQEASGDHQFKLVDILFFYQWELNDYLKHNGGRYYKDLQRDIDLYNKIKPILIKAYGDENLIRNEENAVNIRYKKVSDIVKDLENSGFIGDNAKVQDYLNHFTITDVLYHFGRCTAVHEGYTLLLQSTTNIATNTDGYRESYLITTDLLIKTLNNILDRWELICKSEEKMPYEECVIDKFLCKDIAYKGAAREKN